MKINRFEDIEVWQLSRLLVKEIYLLTYGESFSKDFSLVNQIRRAAASIMANISEGYERQSKKELIHFLYISKGSCGELRSHLYITLDLNYITQMEFDDFNAKVEKVSKSLGGFIKYLKGFKD